MIQVDLDPATRHLDPAFERKLREAKLACKEAAGWRCEWLYNNGQRCKTHEGQLKRKKGRYGRPASWTVEHMHGCHADQDRLNPHPRLICLCAKHHATFDRNAEAHTQARMYRRGYQLTSTDALIEHLHFTGISIYELSDGYRWEIDETALSGHRTSAIFAVGAAIYHMRRLLCQQATDLAEAQDAIGHLQAELELQHAVNRSLLANIATLCGNQRIRMGASGEQNP